MRMPKKFHSLPEKDKQPLPRVVRATVKTLSVDVMDVYPPKHANTLKVISILRESLIRGDYNPNWESFKAPKFRE